jgi:6-phosphofructo-2-kinase/fructose-2,6-biphosphatase 2
LLGYFLETSEEELPWLEVPFHTVVKLSPIAYGCKVEYIPLGVPSVSTHREKPEIPGTLDKR